MDSLKTLPQTTWSERLSGILAGALTLLGTLSILGWLTHSDILLHPLAGLAPIKFNGAISILFIGITMLGLEFKIQRAIWFVLVPIAVNLITLGQYVMNANWHIDELFISDLQVIDTMYPGRVSLTTSLVFFLISSALLLKGFSKPNQFKLTVEAIIGSIAGYAGFSTLVGYAADLPAVYTWGTGTAPARPRRQSRHWAY